MKYLRCQFVLCIVILYQICVGLRLQKLHVRRCFLLYLYRRIVKTRVLKNVADVPCVQVQVQVCSIEDHDWITTTAAAAAAAAATATTTTAATAAA